MGYIMLLISSTGILLATKHRETYEHYFNFKLICYWLISIITLTISGSIPMPLGTAVAVFIFYGARVNKRAKLYTIISGFIGYILSVIVFIIKS